MLQTQTTLRDYMQSIEDAISAGHLDDAMAKCQQILAHYPDALEAQRLLGEIYLAQDRLEEAQQTFDWILTNDPENVIVYCDRALVCERMSDIDTALDCYQQAYELSRGNSQIRQEFNQLSAKVGQQEFMFSRAGLARLYMRGDLLTQAIQEWEAVLAVTPDRLDARLGLLETYWREGVYDKVEETATQILEEVPACLKALLLLAHVTSASNIQRARELIRRAETLDPELQMAQGLFSDLAASQPNDPFLALLKKEPIIFPDTFNGQSTSAISAATTIQHTSVEAHSPPTPIPSPEPAAPSDHDYQGNNEGEPELETWASRPAIGDDFDPTLLEQQPWFQAEQLTASSPEPATSRSDSGIASPMHGLDAHPEEEEMPSPPAWLDMLTRGDRRRADEAPSPLSAQSRIVEKADLPAQPQAESALPTRASREGEASTPSVLSPQPEAPAFFFAPDEKDAELNWPEWLKSLGAEIMEPEPEPEPQAEEPAATLSPAEPQEPAYFNSWADQIDQTLSEAEEQHRATLENLEQNLLSQGFVPLQPGSLSTIAQEPSLPSALAQLGNLAPPPAQPVEPPQPAATSRITVPLNPSEPVPPWRARPSTPSQAPAAEAPASPTVEPASTPGAALPQDAPIQPAQQGETPPNQVHETADTPVANTQPAVPATPAYRADALLEQELETTMKRPAVRLQPMPSSATSTDQPYLAGRGRPGERGTGGKAAEGNLSNKERLVRGYQCQLAGAYDDAMQEYRIVIRNAPELLDEVISNVRALLKLAPKYSAGYRVLGDAYMRRGEYLQAMEAYNKALTIARRAKSQLNQ